MTDEMIFKKCCEGLWVSEKTVVTARKVLNLAEGHFNLSRCKRETVIGAAIVIGSILNKEKVLSSEVARVLNVSPASIRKHYKRMADYLEEPVVGYEAYGQDIP